MIPPSFISKSDDLIKLDDLIESKYHFKLFDYMLDNLLDEYNSKNDITLEDIIDFHYKFERTHPFRDDNGRIGRIIMFKK